MDASVWLRLALTLFVLYLWTDNLLHSYKLWNEHGDARSFRAFLISFMIELGCLAFLFGSLALFDVALLVVSRFFALIVTGALLVVGVFAFVSWRIR